MTKEGPGPDQVKAENLCRLCLALAAALFGLFLFALLTKIF